MELRKFVAPEVITGINARLQIHLFLRRYRTKRTLVATDKNVALLPWAQDVFLTLQKHDIKYVVFDNISPNPRDFEVAEGAEVYHNFNCDSILAIGGGSVIDCAKGIGIVVQHNFEPVASFEGVDKLTSPLPPFFCIPSTSGSAADVSQFAIITNTTQKVKIAIISKSLVPDLSLVDPIPLTTMPKQLMAATTIDSLVHATEAFVSLGASAITDLHASKAIQIIAEYLPKALAQPSNINYIEQLMNACYFAGVAFSNASLGTVHAMAHSLGGLLDLPHGQCNAILFPHVIEYNYDEAAERYQLFAQWLTRSQVDFSKHEVINLVKEFIKNTELPSGLAKFGLTESVIRQLTMVSLQDPCNATNPKEPSYSGVFEIFNRAL